MKKQLLKIALINIAGLGLLAGAALACDETTCPELFKISDITFTTQGTSENLTWSVAKQQPDNFTLDLLDAKTFVYGKFTTSDFKFDESDLTDSDDSFKVSYAIAPPVDGFDVSGIASVDAYLKKNKTGELLVDFDNDWVAVGFGNGGKYSYSFNDLTIKNNGTYNLTANIKLLQCASPDPTPDPVPEPTAMLLFGAGVLGLAGVVRRKRS